MKPTQAQLNQLASICSRVFELNLEDFYSTTRRPKAVDARRTFFHVIKTHHKIREKALADMLSFAKDRTTLYYHNEMVDFILKTDYNFSIKYKEAYEEYTGEQYTKPIPPQRIIEKYKPNIDYRYLGDRGICSAKITSKRKVEYLSEEFKNKVRTLYIATKNYHRIKQELKASTRLVNAIMSA